MKIKAINNIRHNDILHKKGEVFEIEQTSGEILIQNGSAELAQDKVDEISYEKLEKLSIVALKHYAESSNITIKSNKKNEIINEILEGLNEI